MVKSPEMSSKLIPPAVCRIIEGYSEQVPHPLERLKFVRMCTSVNQQYTRFVQGWPFGAWFYRLMFLDFLARTTRVSKPKLSWRDRWLLWFFRRRNNVCRHPKTALALAALLLWFAGGFSISQRESHTPAQGAAKSITQDVLEPPAPLQTEWEGASPVPEIWLVETKQNTELYSNGLRVVNDFVTHTSRRSFPVFPRNSGSELSDIEWRDRPVGLVFHTTESDLPPLEKANNPLIRYQGKLLLGYVQRKKLYNFVIDRFGRVFRIVPESEYANHAGYSMWSYGDELYVNLNRSFIGISFETRLAAVGPKVPHEEGVTPAQFSSGRLLTEMLRYKFNLPAANAVTHEMVSLNPDKLLIGYHTDWRGQFPFGSLGLPNNYEGPLPSVAEWGFVYDSQFVRDVGGRLWPGIRRSQEAFRQEAVRRGISVESYRQQRRKSFWRLLQKIKQSHKTRSRAGQGRFENSRPLKTAGSLAAEE